ncbi:Fibronectin type III-like domain [Dillenia turbinata]|uniref:Fibronectin type III-like domain n=1 Tax=Dillenia turbinata TaxID=194707 RepID=A0AAN8W591_9MAGN
MGLQKILIISLTCLTIMFTTQATKPPFSCDQPDTSTKSYPFCQTKLPIAQRVKDLVSRLTLDEKISQLVNTAPAIPRLGIPAFEWWSEALHGVANAGKGISFDGPIKAATSFPQVILTAASFDVHLWYRIASVIAKEARAVYNAGQATGMTFWAPNINIFRDPRWGRGQETPGEDPLVTGKYAISYVRGVQGDSFHGGKLRDGHLQASACCKHFTAYDLDNWKGIGRFVFDAKVSPQDLADTYQPPFQSCIQEGRASGIMCAYNRVNEVPNCADYNLLTKTARELWKFQGYITSDCDAVSIIYENQGYAKSPEDAVADVLKAGMDLNCGTYMLNHTKSAIQKGKAPVAQIDRALHNLFSVRMRLGLFNGDPTRLPYGKIGPDQVCSHDHQRLALDAAKDGIVLLKNSGRLLPLSKTKTPSLAVIGPNANAPQTLLGNYFGPPCRSVTPLQGLQSYVKNTVHHQGCDFVNCTSASIGEAVALAKSVDYVVLVMGLDQTWEREDHDRDDLVLPGKQQSLITRVAKAARKPIVLVLLCGGPVDVTFAKYDRNVGSILWAGYPGEAGGTAIAQIIFGDHNPGGRLPITWYPKDFIKVPMTDMRMRPDPSTGYPGRTYRFYKGETVFEYGYGLSYSNYAYEFACTEHKKLYLNQTAVSDANKKLDSDRFALVSELGSDACEKMKYSETIRVKNEGDMPGKHSVLLFVENGQPKEGRPIKRLIGFKSVILKAGESTDINFTVSPCEHLSSANVDGIMAMEEGLHYMVVGNEKRLLTTII